MKAARLTPQVASERLAQLDGRPRKRDWHVHVAFNDEEQRDVRAAADRIGLGITQFVRAAVLEKVRA